MTIDAEATAATLLGRLRWAVADTWVLTRRTLLHWTRQPAPVLLGLLFPVMTVLMFAYLFGGQMSLPGGVSYREFLLPGMFAMTMLFGIETTFAAVSTDAARGVTDRFRSLPMASSAVVAGRSAADMIQSVLGLAVMIGCGLAVGWRWHGTLGGAALAVGLLLLLRLALIWAGICLALAFGSPETLVVVQILVWPLGFLSSTFATPATMPGWLGVLAEWNPLSATVTAARQLFGNPTGSEGASWIVQHSLLMAVAWPLLILAICFPLAVWRYRASWD
jgi:ABC-type multidrug transport system permease subunit